MTTIEDIKQILVVGSGTMGSQIAQQAALNGFSVTLYDVEQAQLERAMKSNRDLLYSRVSKGKMSQEEADAALARVVPSTNLDESGATADFVIEAIFEDLQAKRELYARLDKVCPPHTILASNSSTIVISKIVNDNVERKDKACNMHFFHPVLVMKLVEVVKGPDTSDETAELAMELGRRMGKEAVLMQKEIFGFIVNNLLSEMMGAAMRLYEGGYASYEDIDKAMKLGLNHPMGPFELSDFSGLDVWNFVSTQKYAESGDPKDKPSEAVAKLVSEGKLGRKSGEGFYKY